MTTVPETSVRVNVPALPPGYTARYDLAEGIVSILDRLDRVVWDEFADDIPEARAMVTHVADYGYEAPCSRRGCGNLAAWDLGDDGDAIVHCYCSSECARRDF